MIFQNLQLQKALDESGAAKVTAVLRAVPGVDEVGAADGASLVAIAFDERTSLHELATALARAGHPLRTPGSGPCCGACGGCG